VCSSSCLCAIYIIDWPVLGAQQWAQSGRPEGAPKETESGSFWAPLLSTSLSFASFQLERNVNQMAAGQSLQSAPPWQRSPLALSEQTRLAALAARRPFGYEFP